MILGEGGEGEGGQACSLNGKIYCLLLMFSCTLSDVCLLFKISFVELSHLFGSTWCNGNGPCGLIDLIMPSYGKSEICRSCLSGPMSVSVLLASIHSAHHSNNNNLSLIFFPLQVYDYLNFGNCCTTLPHVMQMHQAFFSIRRSRFIL